ncbi:MAG TPA: hypothetical protein PKM73_14640 [Verrucomicrobiota bacterium]|nr:hypothetical protein [Verrucomicrobiota bacterium]HNU49809.1 hypothetical protein [Verrucomicrobiota bacterium]
MAVNFLSANLLGLTVATLTLEAADMVWTNSNGGSWGTAANWEPNRVPGADDAVFITRAGTYTVTLNADAAIREFVLGSESGTQTLATAGRALALGGTGRVGANGRLLLSGGALSGTGRLEVEGGMTWQSGSVDAGAALLVRESGTVTLESAGNAAKVLAGSLTNAGIVTWKPHGGFRVDGTFHNLPGALFDIQEDNISITRTEDGASIVNEGLMRKSIAGVLSCSVPLIQRGTVETLAGTLNLDAGGVLGSGCAFSGAGLTRLTSGTNVLEGDLHSAGLSLSGASLAGEGRLHGILVWESGILLPGASMTILSGAELVVSSAGNRVKSILGNLTNAGVFTWRMYGNIRLGGTFHNLPGATFDIQLDSRVMSPETAGAFFLNEGLLRKTNGVYTVGCDVPTLNRGTIELTSGTLSFNAGCTHESGAIQLAGGTLSGAAGIELAGGRLSGWGTLSGDLLNRAGTVSPDPANGGLEIKGQYTQKLLGTLELTLAGNRPGIDQSRLDVSQEARMGGALDVILAPGHEPVAGTTFEIVTCRTRTGEFDAVNGGYLLGRDLRLTPSYARDRIALLTVAAPDPAEVPLGVTARDDAVLVFWPTEFAGGTLFSKNRMGDPEWTPLPDASHRFIESPPGPERYFRLGPP